MDGTIELAGLQEPVTIHRDQSGIPHIYASNTHDLFLAQGYVHAQDRFWQMDFWRHLGAGRLAELFGQSEVSKDRFLRTLGWERIAEQELAGLDLADRTVLEAYAQGVNSYLGDRSKHDISLEYTALTLTNPGYQPAAWQPLHTLTWPKVMAWDLDKHQLELELERARLLKSFSREQIETLFPTYPEEHPAILSPQFEAAALRSDAAGVALPQPTASDRSLRRVEQNLAPLQELFPAEPGLGSNSWVVSGDRTSTSQPLLANDPHLGPEIPSIWYQVGLHCRPQGPDCPYDVTGVSFAGVPGVIIGHSDRTAWGLTHGLADSLDLYIEKINPDNPDQYEVNGEWVDMEQVQEEILVAGAEPVSQTVRYTRHGPIISETYQPLEQFASKTGLDLPQEYAIALRWTGLEPSTIFSSILQINRADSWSEFRQGAAEFDIVPHNLVYADIEGNIGYQMPGEIPIRDRGQGRYPSPGWTTNHDWQGYIPFDQLPTALNPPQGYVVTANNPPFGEGYPYLITHDWSYGFRAERIQQLLEQAPTALTLADMQRIQTDSKSPLAEILLPELLRLSFLDPQLQQAQQLLQGWNQQYQQNQAAPAILGMVWKQLLAQTFHDQLPAAYQPDGSDRWIEVVRQQLQQPASPWWDDASTAAIEQRDDILRQSFAAAISALEERWGSNLQAWQWGDLHGVNFIHQTLGKSGMPPVEWLFNRGPVPASGGRGTINAIVWDAAKSFDITAIPSMRMIVDFSDLDNSQIVNATGQSGHAFHPHYADQMELWQQLEYRPMGADTDKAATLRLMPQS